MYNVSMNANPPPLTFSAMQRLQDYVSERVDEAHHGLTMRGVPVDKRRVERKIGLVLKRVYEVAVQEHIRIAELKRQASAPLPEVLPKSAGHTRAVIDFSLTESVPKSRNASAPPSLETQRYRTDFMPGLSRTDAVNVVRQPGESITRNIPENIRRLKQDIAWERRLEFPQSSGGNTYPFDIDGDIPKELYLRIIDLKALEVVPIITHPRNYSYFYKSKEMSKILRHDCGKGRYTIRMDSGGWCPLQDVAESSNLVS